MKKFTPFRTTAYIIILLFATFCELVFQRIAYAERGYATIGGEILVFPAVFLGLSFLFEYFMRKIGEYDSEEDDD